MQMSSFRFTSWRAAEVQSAKQLAPAAHGSESGWDSALRQAIESETQNLKNQDNAFIGRAGLKLR